VRFQAVAVVQEEGETEVGRFTVAAPAMDVDGNPAGVRYGLEDESARVNLNALLVMEEQLKAVGTATTAAASVLGQAATGQASSGQSSSGQSQSAGAAEEGESLDTDTSVRDLLMALPGMTVETADAILDWMDEDDEPREFGAESEYYSSLTPPYSPKNGPLETVEELLLVRDVTPQLLFGADVNRNGLIDDSELAQGQGTSTTDGTVSRGWSSLLTLHSKETNLNSTGEPRIDLNNDDLQALSDSLSLVLPQDWCVFILAYRQNGAYTGNEAAVEYSEGELDLSQGGKTKFTQVLDLIGQKVQVKFRGSDKNTVLQSPFGEDLASMSSYMTDLMDNVTIVPDTVIPGRINVNQAPREILLGIPGMSEEIVEQIINQRSPQPEVESPGRTHETWLLTEGLVTLEEMRMLMPFVCAGGDVYRAQVIGYYDDGRSAARLEVVLDATQQPPRILLWRDISHLGRGYALETLGVGTAGQTN
jgi:DNA uptake protein ComE-like DNA-binding protein